MTDNLANHLIPRRSAQGYAGVSLPSVIAAGSPTRFAILVTSETHGSEVRLVPAPKE